MIGVSTLPSLFLFFFFLSFLGVLSTFSLLLGDPEEEDELSGLGVLPSSLGVFTSFFGVFPSFLGVFEGVCPSLAMVFEGVCPSLAMVLLSGVAALASLPAAFSFSSLDCLGVEASAFLMGARPFSCFLGFCGSEGR